MASASNTRVLVTGSSGFIATHVVQQLQQQGYKVRGTVRSKSNEKKVKPLLSLCPNAEHELELVEADLMKPDGWPEAVTGCDYVMHMASPFPSEEPDDENEVIKPAVEGTLQVLRACKEVKCVKRFVLTSSCAYIHGSYDKTNEECYTEEDWTNVETSKQAYYKSKTLAEKAAWDFVKDLADDEKFELVTVNPSLVLGPVLCGTFTTSLEVIKRLLCREVPFLPRLSFPIVDVRDVAACHLATMTVPEASGHRHIAYCQSLWFTDVAAILEKEFKGQGYKVPTSTAPYPLLWIMGRFDKSVRSMLPSIGKVLNHSNSRMKNVLSVQPHPTEETILDMAYSMIESGFINKTKDYKPRSEAAATGVEPETAAPE